MGVITATPRFARSSQSLMPLGLPLRTRNTIVDVYGELLCGKRVCQFSGSSLPFCAIASMSYASASVTTSASMPSITLLACAPEPPCDCLMTTFSPVLAQPVLGKAGVEIRVEFTRRIIGNVEQRFVGVDVERQCCRDRERECGEESGSIHEILPINIRNMSVKTYGDIEWPAKAARGGLGLVRRRLS